jgi:hypothetical protein
LPIINNTAVIWTLPIVHNKLLFSHASKKLDNLIGGWQVTAFNKFNSGPTLTPNYTPAGSQELSNSGGVMYRPYLNPQLSAQAAKRRLHIPHHPEEAFCDTVYASPTQSAYNGCTTAFLIPGTTTLPVAGTAVSIDPRGNVTNECLRGDSFDELDAGVNKKFSLPWEKSFLELRFDVYNAVNKTNFTAPGMTCCSTSFGPISSTFGLGRIAQVQALISF